MTAGAQSEVMTADAYEVRFEELRDGAGYLSTASVGASASTGGPEFLGRGDQPDALLHELRTFARLDHDAALHLLGDPWTAQATDMPLRGLLEAFAHVSFVFGTDTAHRVGTARQRACCLALGRAAELYRVQRYRIVGDAAPIGNTRVAAARLRFFRKLHEVEGCPRPSPDK